MVASETKMILLHLHEEFATPMGCCESFEWPQSGDELAGKCGGELGS